MKESKPSIPKWLKWEFWPYWFFYIPVYFLIIIHAFRSRTLSYFTLVNPGMKLGGFSAYSKYDILRQLQKKYLPKTILFNHRPSVDEVLSAMKTESISFPIILKPDEGERGWKVEKISDENGIREYLPDASDQLILQEYIALPEEYGVMYYRHPSQKSGTISSLMKREFLTVAGDGTSTLLELFLQSERCHYHLPRLKKKFHDELNLVLREGEKKVLEEIGNHNRGTTFLDAHDLICDELVQRFDEASSTLHEWYFGRFDVRTASYQEMVKGNFKVVEVNGANSEPAHIYDPNMSLMKAYRDLFQHWNTIFQISRENRRRGFLPDKTKDVIHLIREHGREKKEHPNRL
ncbi:MAG TPA: hypothetical protein VE978_22515 [Chitinophagales bacterium]|nr:hypothetical protein [Chitinophagales bacterium]